MTKNNLREWRAHKQLPNYDICMYGNRIGKGDENTAHARSRTNH